MYLNESDLFMLVSWLNAETEIAFIVANGPSMWCAVHSIDQLSDFRYCLWHSGSGPLPLLRKHLPDTTVRDPWKGWKEKRPGANPATPYFGAGHPGVYWLNAKTESSREEGALGLSSFEWIGNRYAAIGSPAPPITKKWWERLRRWVKKIAVQIPREGHVDGEGKEIWALPGALNEIKQGRIRDVNP
jgi:hypothetical protein